MKRIVLLIPLSILVTGWLQPSQLCGKGVCSLPETFSAKLASKNLASKYQVSPSLSPCFLRGDFDGDGKSDFAVAVRQRGTGKSGIIVCHSGGHLCTVLGAGEIFEGEDNLDWMDFWSVYKKGPVEPGVGEPTPPKLIGDAILAEKSEAASGLIYWNSKRYVW